MNLGSMSDLRAQGNGIGSDGCLRMFKTHMLEEGGRRGSLEHLGQGDCGKSKLSIIEEQKGGYCI